MQSINQPINSIISGRNPLLYYCTLTLVTMQGHQNRNKEHQECINTVYFDSRVQDYSSINSSMVKKKRIYVADVINSIVYT